MASVSDESSFFSAEQQRMRPPCMRTEAAMTSVSEGVVDGPVMELFADSVPMGDRVIFYCCLYLAFWSGALAGPMAGGALFLAQDNGWTFAARSRKRAPRR